MQMVHVEDKFIDTIGEVNWEAAQGAQHGVAILSILFYVDNKKPQVRLKIVIVKIFIKIWFLFSKVIILFR